MEFLKRLIVEEEGQGLTEYALILGLIVLGVWLAVAFSPLGNNITNIFSSVSSSVADCC